MLLHAYLTWALDVGFLSASRPCPFLGSCCEMMDGRIEGVFLQLFLTKPWKTNAVTITEEKEVKAGKTGIPIYSVTVLSCHFALSYSLSTKQPQPINWSSNANTARNCLRSREIKSYFQTISILTYPFLSLSRNRAFCSAPLQIYIFLLLFPVFFNFPFIPSEVR